MHTPGPLKSNKSLGENHIWYQCSCGASGGLRKTQEEALTSVQHHVDRANEEEQAERIRAAAPKLIEALEELVEHPDDPTSRARARAFIAEAKGE